VPLSALGILSWAELFDRSSLAGVVEAWYWVTDPFVLHQAYDVRQRMLDLLSKKDITLHYVMPEVSPAAASFERWLSMLREFEAASGKQYKGRVIGLKVQESDRRLMFMHGVRGLLLVSKAPPNDPRSVVLDAYASLALGNKEVSAFRATVGDRSHPETILIRLSEVVASEWYEGCPPMKAFIEREERGTGQPGRHRSHLYAPHGSLRPSAQHYGSGYGESKNEVYR
jgi:hypothetical protein